MDLGSQRTFISAKLAHSLQLKPLRYEHLDISVFGDQHQRSQKFPRVKLHILPCQGKPVVIEALVSPIISGEILNCDTTVVKAMYPYLANLSLAPPCPGTKFTLDALIGADYYWELGGNEIIRGTESAGPSPVAINSKFGYLISGPAILPQPHTTSTECPSINSILNVISHENFEVSEYFEIESLGIKDQSTDGDEKTVDSVTFEDYSNNYIKRDNGHYIAWLTWNEQKHLLPTNYASCESQTRKMVRKLTPEKLAAYDRIIRDQKSRGFVENTQRTTDKNRGHYLKHYCIEKLSSTSTPLRIVYRCNDRYGGAPSLNDCLDPGEPLLQDLGGIWMRTRLFEIALCADIEKAFLKIELADEDREYTKFLWITDPTDCESPFEELQFRSILFGATCSPFILNSVLRKHLLLYNDVMSNQLMTDIYVDNVLTSISDYDTALKFYKNSCTLLKEAGFNLREWSTNNRRLQSLIMNDNKNMAGNEICTLGMIWNIINDTLKCKPLHAIDPNEVITPKTCLRETARLYDVPGFLLPVHVQAKLFLQSMQKNKMGWHQPLSNDQKSEWIAIHRELCEATQITWPRQIIKGLTPYTSVEIHVFCDASLKSYGSTVYIVANGHSRINWAKNKLSPLNQSPRIPRLELNSCLLGANLIQYVRKSIGSRVNIKKTYLWSDSQVAICWLFSKKKLEVYVRNRRDKIMKVGFDEIRYTGSSSNPSDLLTRGISAEHLKNSNLWWRGPVWLTDPKKFPQWTIPHSSSQAESTVLAVIAGRLPTIEEQAEDIVEQPPFPLVSTSWDPLNIINITNYSTLNRLLRTTVLFMRIASKLKLVLTRIRQRARGLPTPNTSVGKSISAADPINADDLLTARNLWVLKVQTKEFLQEKKFLLKQHKNMGPLVKQLKLFIDDKGLIRKGSRLHHSSVSYDCKFPILLPKDDRLTYLIISEIHGKKLLHSGPGSVVTHLKQSYWIPHAHVKVRSILRKCTTCQKVNARAYTLPATPPLPKWRLLDAPAFTNCGVDYTGEIYLRNERGELHKAYICLFTCAVSRGVHLDYVTNLTPEQFLFCFRRFAARKSTPSIVSSDNATYFQSSAEIIVNIMRDRKIQTYMAEQSWRFIVKKGPTWGAFWERLIGTMKRTLKKVIGRAFINECELSTILPEIEAVMNDRPLTQITSDTDAPQPLTPSHLIYGRMIKPLIFPEVDMEDDDFQLNGENANKRLKYLSSLLQNYWERYHEEYLPLLRDRHKLSDSQSTKTKIKIGDVVLVHEDVTKRPLWKMAVVTKLLTGPDGLTRAAEIKTQHCITTRPINKLYHLELNDGNKTHQAQVKKLASDIQQRTQHTRAAKTVALGKIKQIALE